mgnify:CR=1 FL=1
MVFMPASLEMAEYALIRQAKTEWEAAENFFNEVTDPDMVEFAVLRLSAAIKKYEYLFRKIKCRTTL